jgi:hypothetical protein
MTIRETKKRLYVSSPWGEETGEGGRQSKIVAGDKELKPEAVFWLA